MIYHDLIYGPVEIKEPVVLELINSSALTRLKGISQACRFDDRYGDCDNRFEHSLGVFCLLRKYKASLDEQIAGLLHDVSHLTFSHCIDYVFEEISGEKQSYQDDIFTAFINETEIPEIIKKHGFNLSYILNDENFPLKEKKLPELCADRIDYSLRGAVRYGEIAKEKADYFLDRLLVKNNCWLFRDYASAEEYAKLFKSLNNRYYAALDAAIMHRVQSDYLKYGLKKGYIKEKDFYLTDKEVLSKLEKFWRDDNELKKLYEKSQDAHAVNSPDDFDSLIVLKSRLVDPWCKHEGKVMRVSEISADWKKTIAEELAPRKFYLKFCKTLKF